LVCNREPVAVQVEAREKERVDNCLNCHRKQNRTPNPSRSLSLSRNLMPSMSRSQNLNQS
jgi:hypothetical protein